MNQWDFMDLYDEDMAAVFGQHFENYLPPRSNSSSSTLISIPGSFTAPITEQSKQHNPDSYSCFSTSDSVINPDQAVLTFWNQNSPRNLHRVYPEPALNPEKEDVLLPQASNSKGSSYNENSEEAMKRVQPTKKRSRIRPPSQTYDHIVAERRRREQLSQLFVALSTIVPGLKKMDKSSVLEDAIKYLKHLQERVKKMEEQAEKQSEESVVFVRKSQIVAEDEGSSDEQSGSYDEQPLPEIEARICDNRILIRVHCENQKGVLVNLLCKVESLNMAIFNTIATPFGNVALDVTIIAELEEEFNLTMKEVATAIRSVLLPARAAA
ncbi:UNVERIFIED_CONTAM: Transcription factor [Sesamum latifolium]|uniref:Transcription factor n=1 Tax=Sesamum latifolium TaxID=2727402 RepID=A0AAW2X8E9_9LAMI